MKEIMSILGCIILIYYADFMVMEFKIDLQCRICIINSNLLTAKSITGILGDTYNGGEQHENL